MTQSLGLSAILPGYDALLLDLWGVVHDGSQTYPGVREALQEIKRQEKHILFISNAPRRAWKVMDVLSALGIERTWYDGVVSSGEVGYEWLRQGGCGWGKRYYYIGPAKDEDVLDGLDYQAVTQLEQADFLLNVGYGSEEQTEDDLTPLIRAARNRDIPMLCLNPDLEVVKITGERYPCAGVLAHDYERIGGNVTWFGKPHQAIYDACFSLLPGIARSRILAIGDSLETDIPGAMRAGIDSLLISGGILKDLSLAEIESQCMALRLSPNYTMPRLAYYSHST